MTKALMFVIMLVLLINKIKKINKRVYMKSIELSFEFLPTNNKAILAVDETLNSL